MKLLITGIQATFLLDKQRQRIFVDTAFFVKSIFPDKTFMLPVLTDGRISDQIPVFVQRIHIKNKDSVLIQIIMHQ